MGPTKKTANARRSHLRALVVPVEIKIIVSRPTGEDRYPGLLWDVSEKGLGLWIPEKIRTGIRIQIVMVNPLKVNIQGEVVWCRKEENMQGFRCGVDLSAPFDKLDDLTSIVKAMRQKKTENAK